MFESFFPRPKQFFLSFVVYAIGCVLAWYFLFKGLGDWLSLGGLAGMGFPEALSEPASDADRAAFEAASERPQSFWLYQYVIGSYVVFAAVWMAIANHKWARWSVAGSALIIFVTWFQVQLDVFFNAWYRDFFDMVQEALAEPNAVSLEEYYGQIFTFLSVALPYVIIVVLKIYFVNHYVFRWSTAMNDRYMNLWERVRHIEGASQRVQDDTMRFARIVEGLGVSIIDSFMTLIAFLPILWGLSQYVSEVPIFGEVPQ
ncbi:MAG: SbmA/BacA-like family transporter, partial [Pseudomonadota bacterium]